MVTAMSISKHLSYPVVSGTMNCFESQLTATQQWRLLQHPELATIQTTPKTLALVVRCRTRIIGLLPASNIQYQITGEGAFGIGASGRPDGKVGKKVGSVSGILGSGGFISQHIRGRPRVTLCREGGAAGPAGHVDKSVLKVQYLYPRKQLSSQRGRAWGVSDVAVVVRQQGILLRLTTFGCLLRGNLPRSC